MTDIKESPATDPATKEAGRNGGEVTAVVHAIAALQCLDAQQPELGVNEIARRIGVHKSTASRLLATLENAAFVARNPETGRFRLGMGLITLVSPLLAGMDVVRAARPILDALAAEEGETSSLGLWNGHQVLMVEQTKGSRPIGHLAPANARVPAHCVAGGKILLAHLPPAELEGFLATGLRAYTPLSLTNRDALLADLRVARQRGYAINVEEYEPETAGLATLIRSASGAPAAALAVSVPSHRFDAARQQQLATRLLKDAAEVSQRLGWIGGA